MSALYNGPFWLSAAHERAFSQPAVYRRGKQSVTINLTVAKSGMTLSPEFGGTQTRVGDKDFILNVPATLVICGEQITPKTGDLIEIQEGGNTSRYAVRIPDGGEQEFEWDDLRASLRIHTKFWKLTNGCAT